MNQSPPEDNKQKPKGMPNRWSCWQIGIITLITVLGCGMLIVLLWLYLEWTGPVRTELEAEFVPTAEYLLANPQPNTGDFDADLEIRNYQICVVVIGRIRNKDDAFAASNFRLFVNEQQVGRKNISIFWNGLTSLPTNAYFCFANTLMPGLHLIEFHHSGTTYQWAIEVE